MMAGEKNWVEKSGIKAVFFDMDGVIYDSMGHHAEAWSKAFQSCGFHFPPEEVYMNEGRTGIGTIQLLYRERLNREATIQEIELIYARKTEVFENLNPIYPLKGIFDFMQRIHNSGISIWVVTGSQQDGLLLKLCDDFHGLVTVDKIVSGKEAIHGKPHPEPYLKALERSGFVSKEVVVIENAPLGIESAKAANIFTIAVNTGILSDSILWNSGADRVFKDISQVDYFFFSR